MKKVELFVLCANLSALCQTHYREVGESTNVDVSLTVEDEIHRVASIRMSGKLRSFDFSAEQKNVVKVNLLLSEINQLSLS